MLLGVILDAGCAGPTAATSPSNSDPTSSTSSIGGSTEDSETASSGSDSGGTGSRASSKGREATSASTNTRASGGISGRASSNGGAASSASSKSHASGGTSARASSNGGAANSASSKRERGGAEATATGATSCKPPNTDGPAEHASSGYESQPCADCHKNALRGGLVFDQSGAVVAQATVTIKLKDNSELVAATNANGMFVFRETIEAPYVACVSKCPDTVCSKSTDHPSVADCGTCHGVTASQIHLP